MIGESKDKSVIGVVGAGTMGAGIAQVAASHGHRVTLYDVNSDILKSAELKLGKILDRLVEKLKLTEFEAGKIRDNILFTDNFEFDESYDFIVEAIVEDLAHKKEVFSKLENRTDGSTILATNTSSLSITAIASACNQPQRVIGTHFFNPAPLMKLVEVVPGLKTSRSTVDSATNLLLSWGKKIVTAKDTPGFIVNRVARPFYGEALRILDEGIAGVTAIDDAMKKIGGFKMGPFELMDLIGNDVNYKVTETVFEQFYYDPRYKPSITQKRLVEAGSLGRKTGSGFYDYEDQSRNPVPDEDENLAIEIFFRILVMLVNEAADAVYMNVASTEDVDMAMIDGTNYPKGLLKWADEIGVDKIVRRLIMLHEDYGEDRYRVSPLLRKMNKEGKKFYS